MFQVNIKNKETNISIPISTKPISFLKSVNVLGWKYESVGDEIKKDDLLEVTISSKQRAKCIAFFAESYFTFDDNIHVCVVQYYLSERLSRVINLINFTNM